MLRKQLTVFAIALTLLFSMSVIRPARAHAANTWVIAGICTGAYIVGVSIATYFIFRQPMVDGRDLMKEADAKRNRIQLANNCPPGPDGTVPLACW